MHIAAPTEFVLGIGMRHGLFPQEKILPFANAADTSILKFQNIRARIIVQGVEPHIVTSVRLRLGVFLNKRQQPPIVKNGILSTPVVH
jgi:hypothetical protein